MKICQKYLYRMRLKVLRKNDALRTRVAELESAIGRIRETSDHKCLNLLEKVVTISTILTTIR
jgi:hypothetical protein